MYTSYKRNYTLSRIGLMAWLMLFCIGNVKAETNTVDSTGDQPAVDPSVSALTADGTITLRSAIQRSNASAGLDKIFFNIPESDPGFRPQTESWRIEPQTNLPGIVDQIIINGYTQPGAQKNTLLEADNAILKIEIRGGGKHNPFVNLGLSLQAGSDGSVIKGLVVNNFVGRPFPFLPGIALLASSDGNTIEGNFFSTDVTGTKGIINAQGVSVNPLFGPSANFNSIGGSSVEARNLFGPGTNAFDNGCLIRVRNAFGTQIKGNFIGLDSTGEQNFQSGTNGIMVTLSIDTIIGGTTPEERNIIAGCLLAGIENQACLGTRIIGNHIGTNAQGNKALANGNGVLVGFNEIIGFATNIIGGGQKKRGNLISGNIKNGIEVGIADTGINSNDGSGTIILGNRIGTDVTGENPIPNGQQGISVRNSEDVIIGDAAHRLRNIASGNTENGIRLEQYALLTDVSGNYVGTNIHGDKAVANGFNGIQIGIAQGPSSNNTIIDNVISGNTQSGIFIVANSTENVIQDNLIGLDASGKHALNNGGNGIQIACSSNNLIGRASNFTSTSTFSLAAPAALEISNFIRHNHKGVVVGCDRHDPSVNNTILTNSIFNNEKLGIDLGNDGITPNDKNDPDKGPNNLQNFPVLSSAKRTATSTVVKGKLNSIPGTSFIIQFFKNPIKRKGITEGKIPFGEIIVTTNKHGCVHFKAVLPPVAEDHFVSSTATRLADSGPTDTSEFSESIEVKG